MKKKLFLLILLVTDIIAYKNWFINFSILTYGDWWYMFKETQREFFTLPFSWLSTGLGLPSIVDLPSYFIVLLWGILSKITSFGPSERILFLWPSIILAAISIYSLILRITSSRYSALIGSIVYLFNTYFIIGRTGHLTLMMAFALAPLGILLFIKNIQVKKLYLSVLTGLVFFIIGSYEIRGFYLIAWVCFIYYFWKIFIIDKFSLNSAFVSGVFALIPVLLFVFLNLFWIIGLSKLGLVSSNDIFSRGLFGEGYMTMKESISLFHPFWTGGALQIFVVQPTPLYFYFIPVFAALGLWLNRKNKDVVFFGIVALLGVFLTKQSVQPFPELYKWLYEKLPGFNAFRESSKFFFLTALGYSVLIGSFVGWMFENWNKSKPKEVLKYTLTFLIAAIFICNAKSVITGEIGTMFIPRQVPQDYIILKDFLLSQSDFSRTFWVPTPSRWGIYTNSHPKVGFVDMFLGDWRKLTTNSEKYIQSSPGVEVLKDSSIKNLLSQSSIKYVIVPLQDTANDDDFYIYYGDRNSYVKTLDSLSFLKKIDIGTRDIKIYENSGYKDHVYIEDVGSNKKTNVTYTFVNPTEYKVSINNLTNKTTLTFSDTYHPGWKIKSGKLQWYQALTKKDYFLPDSIHQKSKYNLNSFALDPQYLKDNLSIDEYSVNKDGSLNIDLTLCFYPQSYFYLGGIISLVTLIICILYLLIFGFISLRKKYLKK